MICNLEELRKDIEIAIYRHIPKTNCRPKRLHSAIKYSVSGYAKRLRPLLVFAGYYLYPSNNDPLPAAVAVELIHTYSLIHDDLPCMDNGQLRRGRATCHKVFDEATAVLAGDALQAMAFELISKHYFNTPKLCVNLIQELSVAAGSRKLVGGQMLDILNSKVKNKHEVLLKSIYENKTGSIFAASLVIGAFLSNAPINVIHNMRQIGITLGLGFQILDDILDVTSSNSVLGKDSGQDAKKLKINYPYLKGLKESKDMVNSCQLKIIKQLSCIDGNCSLIRVIIDKIFSILK